MSVKPLNKKQFTDLAMKTEISMYRLEQIAAKTSIPVVRSKVRKLVAELQCDLESAYRMSELAVEGISQLVLIK